MAARKHRPVLYEIAKGGRRAPALKPTIPPPGAASTGGTGPRPGKPAGATKERPLTPPATTEPLPTEPRGVLLPAASGETRPPSALRGETARKPQEPAVPGARLVVRLAGGRLAAAIVGAGLALWIAFEAGRLVGRAQGTPAQAAAEGGSWEAARPAVGEGGDRTGLAPQRANSAGAENSGAAEPGAGVESAAHEAAPATPAAPGGIELRRGYHYVVVQHFARSQRAEAVRAAEFLSASGLRVGLLSGADVRLVVDEPLLIEQPDKQAAAAERERGAALVAKVKALGKEYFRKTGLYDFGGCYVTQAR